MEHKAALRKKYRSARSTLSHQEHAALSGAACQRVRESSLWQCAETVLLYAPVSTELDVSILLEEGWRSGKRVVLPKCRENPRNLEFYEVKSWDELVSGAWNIREPDEQRCRPVQPETIDLALIPVVAMDLSGVRLGNGGGYYDRVMEKFSCPVLIGFDQQLCECLPRDPHDAVAGWLITPTRMIQARNLQ